MQRVGLQGGLRFVVAPWGVLAFRSLLRPFSRGDASTAELRVAQSLCVAILLFPLCIRVLELPSWTSLGCIPRSLWN